MALMILHTIMTLSAPAKTVSLIVPLAVAFLPEHDRNRKFFLCQPGLYYKKDDLTDKENYRPISVLSALLRLLEN